MNKKIIIFCIGLLAVGRVSGLADPGDSSAAFLNIDNSAISASLGEASSALSGNLLSLYSNPSGIADIEGYNLAFSQLFWLEDMNYSNLIAGTALLNGYAAFGFSSFNAGKIDKYNSSGDAMNETYTPADTLITLAYGRNIFEMNTGASIKIISSNIDSDKSTAFALDAGVQKKFNDLKAGFSVQNLGTKLKYIDESESLPLKITAGVAYPLTAGGFDLLVLADTGYSRNVPFKFNAGLQADYPLDKLVLSFRTGYKSYAEGLSAMAHITGGFGIKYNNIDFNYATVSYEDLGLTHRVSLGYSFN